LFIGAKKRKATQGNSGKQNATLQGGILQSGKSKTQFF